jgi:MFS family permease
MTVPKTETIDLVLAQRQTLRLLFVIQIISGIGVGIAGSVGALLAAELVGVSLSGLVQSATVVGSALWALPAAEIVRRGGRRPSLAASYVIAAVGSVLIITAAIRHAIPLLFAGFFLCGGATAAGLQARYAAVDLAPATLRGRHLSLIVWATTVGSVAGPNLAAFAGAYLDDYGVPTLAGPFVFSALLFGVAACVLLLLMRPDPAILARATAHATEHPPSGESVGIRAALRAVAGDPSARLGVAAMAVGHLVMIGVMAMTPVHIRSAGHEAAQTLRIVGVVLSVHIAGMYALAPAIGWITDRIGRPPVILAGFALLLTACALTGRAGHDSARLVVGLLALGIGWSSTMVAGSTLLSESVPLHVRTSAQGLADVIMGLAGASAAAFSGAIVQNWGFATLTLVAGLATAPFIVLAARNIRSRRALPSS